MKKSIAFVYIVFAVVVIFAVVAVAFAFAYPFEKYDRDWIIGKTYQQIIKKYGEFEFAWKNGDDEIYAAGYEWEGDTKYFGMERGYVENLIIYFDENGKAVSTEIKKVI